jgi:trehalose 6-phosphate phosphatase
MIDPRLPLWPTQPALFLDLDGTLVEIAVEPQRVTLSARLRALLPALQPATHGAVAVVSGRRIAELDRLLAPHVFAAAGIHGLERRDAKGRTFSARPNEALLAGARERSASFVARHDGLLLEDKRLSIALHYRQRPDLADEVGRFIEDIERELPLGLEILSGRMVFEIKPNSMDKGGAIRLFMSEAPFAGRTPVFVGDDLTDEAAFQVVNELDGVSVKVHAGATAARWRLDGIAEVLGWLESAVTARSATRIGAAHE